MGISNLTSLRKLCIQNAYYLNNEELSYISNLIRLQSLSISCAYSLLHLEFLCQMKSLNRLNISRTRITDEGVETISKLTCLESLYLYRSDITDIGIEKLTSLARLKIFDIAGNINITNISSSSLMKLPQLCFLDVAETRFNQEGIDLLQLNNPHLQIGLLPLYPLGRRTKKTRMW